MLGMGRTVIVDSTREIAHSRASSCRNGEAGEAGSGADRKRECRERYRLESDRRLQGILALPTAAIE
ncbi:MAG TPA: hypothetical protein VEF34_02460 [Syntrophobacteraceae bacterium]|nr:hypothetical protein [Syntrophobacteraceae bacterium]